MMKQAKHNIISMIVKLTLVLSFSSQADTYIRYNQAGYKPLRNKQIVVMADESQSNSKWQLTSSNGEVILSGVLGNSLYGKSPHTAKPYNYLVDMSNIVALGEYKFTIENNSEVAISINETPYRHLISPILRFLRVARSGTKNALLKQASHLGDAKVDIYRPLGNINIGAWQKDKGKAQIDMLGGWYDAADYIKFTLTAAYTSYYLLRSYQEA